MSNTDDNDAFWNDAQPPADGDAHLFDDFVAEKPTATAASLASQYAWTDLKNASPLIDLMTFYLSTPREGDEGAPPYTNGGLPIFEFAMSEDTFEALRRNANPNDLYGFRIRLTGFPPNIASINLLLALYSLPPIRVKLNHIFAQNVVELHDVRDITSIKMMGILRVTMALPK